MGDSGKQVLAGKRLLHQGRAAMGRRQLLPAIAADKGEGDVAGFQRIGNAADRPADKRRLSIWLSSRDLAQLVAIGIDHPGIRFEIVYGISGNQRAWYDNANAFRLGYKPQDNSEPWAAEMLAKHQDNADPRVELYQGGTFVAAEFGGDPSRPPPKPQRAKRKAARPAAKTRAKRKK